MIESDQHGPEPLTREALAFTSAIDDRFLDRTHIIRDLPGLVGEGEEGVFVRPKEPLADFPEVSTLLLVRPVGSGGEPLPIPARGLKGPRVNLATDDEHSVYDTTFYIGEQDGSVHRHEEALEASPAELVPQESDMTHQESDIALGTNAAWDLVQWVRVAEPEAA